MENVLKKIIDKKKEKIKILKKNYSISTLFTKLNEIGNYKNFKETLENRSRKNILSIIAEIKKASPSVGIIDSKFNHLFIAKELFENGAACLSVLTEEDFFLGKLQYMHDIKTKYNIPILCKDFFIDPYQVPLAKSFGADCILIILSALEKNQVKEIYEASKELNLSTLIEVHDTKEAEFALTFNDSMIGINNRNLKTLEVSLKTTVDLFNVLKECKNPLISESGIKTKSDINFILKKTGIKNFLVGESLLKSTSIKKKLVEFLK